MFGDLAAILSSVGIAPSTYATYAADWKMWVEWRQTVVRKGAYVDMSQGAEAVAVEIAKFMAYLFFARKNKMSTVAGKLVAVQYFHRRAGIELPMKNPYLLQVKSGLARESSIHGEATKTRRPVSWVLLKHGIGLASEWGEGGRVLWLDTGGVVFFHVPGIGIVCD